MLALWCLILNFRSTFCTIHLSFSSFNSTVFLCIYLSRPVPLFTCTTLPPPNHLYLHASLPDSLPVPLSLSLPPSFPPAFSVYELRSLNFTSSNPFLARCKRVKENENRGFMLALGFNFVEVQAWFLNKTL